MKDEATEFLGSYARNQQLNGGNDWIELAFVEREETPRELMKSSVNPHPTGLLLLDTVRILDTFGVERAQSAVHNCVQKDSLQPTDGNNPDHVAIDETVIQLNN